MKRGPKTIEPHTRRDQTQNREEIRDMQHTGYFRKHTESTDLQHHTGKHHSDATKGDGTAENQGKINRTSKQAVKPEQGE